MKRISLMTAIFLTVALISSAVEAGVIPLSGTMEAHEDYQLFGGPPPGTGFLVNGIGTATTQQLGQCTLVYADEVDSSNGVARGGARLIDTNGDSIYALYLGQGSEPDPNGNVHIVETATITGGTGRYANASGNFTVDRMVNVFTFDGDTSGTISGRVVIKGR